MGTIQYTAEQTAIAQTIDRLDAEIARLERLAGAGAVYGARVHLHSAIYDLRKVRGQLATAYAQLETDLRWKQRLEREQEGS